MSTTELSERNCVEIITKLIEHQLLDVVFTVDGKEYVTPQQLSREIRDELFVHGGRINLVELARILNVDLSQVTARAAEIERADSGITLVLGQLIDKSYLTFIAQEINERLAQNGQVSVGDLTRQYDLPSDFLQTVVEKQLGKLIRGKQDKSDPRVFFTESYVTRNTACVRGALAAATRPTPISTMLSQCDVPERMFFSIIDSLMHRKQVPGVVTGKQAGSSIYVPAIYSKSQNDWVNNFYRQNGYLEYDALSRLGISDPKTFVSKHFPGEKLLLLSTCAVGKQLFEQVEASVEEAVTTGSWIDVMVGTNFGECVLAGNTRDSKRPILPSVFEPEDAEEIVTSVLKTKPAAVTVHVFCSTVVVTDSYLNALVTPLESVVQAKAQQVTLGADNRKTTSSSPERDSNFHIPVLGSLVQHQTSALANYATDAVHVRVEFADSITLFTVLVDSFTLFTIRVDSFTLFTVLVDSFCSQSLLTVSLCSRSVLTVSLCSRSLLTVSLCSQSVSSGAYMQAQAESKIHNNKGHMDQEEGNSKADRREERRKKAAGGKTGGGVQGRETKTKSTKKKYHRGKTAAEDSEDEDAPPNKSRGSKGLVGGGKLELVTVSDIREVLRQVESLRDEELEELVDEIAVHLHPTINKSALMTAQSLFESTLSARAHDRRKTHGELQDKLNALLTNVRLFEKGLKQFESKDTQQQLAKYLLKTLCTEIANEIFAYVAAENMIQYDQDKEITAEVRTRITNEAPNNATEPLQKLHKCLTGSSVDDYLACVEVALGTGICDMILRKLDKRKERPMVHSHRQALLEQLSTCTDPALVLHLASLLLFQAVSQTMLHASGRFVFNILTHLASHLAADTFNSLQLYHDLVLKLLSSGEESDGRAEIMQALESKMPEIKEIAITFKKKSVSEKQ
uniref:E3 UFM1-protein ligase 1 homolog n=1 Tax=Timema monikensis TaxID=170555 RepID=A0A7R9HQ20_9NEOP|nr:unnamed protein product [Timema monikensis]